MANPAGRPDPQQTRSFPARGTLQQRSARRALGQATLERGLSVLDQVDDPIPSRLPTFSSLTQALPPGRRRPGCLLPAARLWPPQPRSLGGVDSWDPWGRTHHLRHLQGNCNSPPRPAFFSDVFVLSPPSLGFLSFLFILWGQSGVRKSKHKTNLEAGWGRRGCAEARSAVLRASRGAPRALLRLAGRRPQGPGGAVSCCTGKR